MPPFHLFLALGMLLTGTTNTLSNKAADQMTSTDRYGNTTSFNHPFLQALAMFIGEFFCMIAFYALVLHARYTGKKMDRAKPFNPLIFVIPAVCDMTATSIMYIGLALTDASVFQMLRGSVIIFTSVLSVLFLKRKLYLHHWAGIALVIGGTAIVGTQSYVCVPDAGAVCPAPPSSGPSLSTIGNILIIFAQLIVAVQVCVYRAGEGGFGDDMTLPRISASAAATSSGDYLLLRPLDSGSITRALATADGGGGEAAGRIRRAGSASGRLRGPLWLYHLVRCARGHVPRPDARVPGAAVHDRERGV